MDGMNIYKREMRWNVKGFLIWMIILGLYMLMYTAMTDQLMAEMQKFLDLLDKFPKFFMNLFNMDKEVLSTPEGLFGTEAMSFTYILSAIFGAIISSNLFCKEFEEKTIEFLVAKPVSRNKIFYQKVLALISYIALFAGVFTILLVGMFKIFITTKYDQNILLAYGLYIFAIECFFGSLAVVFSVWFKKTTLTTTLSIALTIIMYFGDSLARSIESLNLLGKIMIFNYLPLMETLKTKNIYFVNAIIIVLVSGVIVYIAGQIFKKTDIKV